MDFRASDFIERQITAHGMADREEVLRLRGLGMEERSKLLEPACEAAIVIHRSRLAAGLPFMGRVPWPASTWEFLRKQTAHVRSYSATGL